MKNLKKWVAVGLSITLVLGMVTGCAKDASQESAYDDDVYEYEDSSQDWDAAKATESVEATESMEAEVQEYSNETGTGYEYAEAADEQVVESALNKSSQVSPSSDKEEFEERNQVQKETKMVYEEPLSTFSLDVDTASYANIRKKLLSGYSLSGIDPSEVRIEEMLNYFDYDFKAPSRNKLFSIYTEIGDCPWNDESKVMMVGMKTKEADDFERKPSNLVFLLDVSGSMSDEDKLPLLQQAFEMLSNELTSEDRVSIVTYASNDEVLLEGVKGNQKRKIMDTLWSLNAGGSTNGSDGIITAYELAQDYFIEGGNNRVIMATDGDLNVGITSDEELKEFIAEKRDTGVYLSILGFGSGNYQDQKMESLADTGNGNYSYIDSEKEAYKVLVEEISSTLSIVAKDVKMQVEFNPEQIKEYRLIGYETRLLEAQDFYDEKKDAGELGYGHCVVALYEIVPTGSTEIPLKYQSKNYKTNSSGLSKDDECCNVKISYKNIDTDEANIFEVPVKGTQSEKNPSDDFVFATSVAQFGLLLEDNGSYYNDEENNLQQEIRTIIKKLKKADYDDSYKEEFIELLSEAYY